jgi:cation diffusion facilitator family transporter
MSDDSGRDGRRRAGVEHGAGVRDKIRAARASIFASLALIGIKLAAAIATSSLGLLAETAHSALDLGAAVVTWVAVRTSWRPPDADHQYGHGKIENLAALSETILLVVTSFWILKEAFGRLTGQGPEVRAGAIGFVAILASIAIDAVRSRDLARVAKASNSQALEADALHFSSDIASSTVVLVGLAGVWLSRHGGPAWLDRADPVAAILVAAFVLLLSWKLGRRAIDMLLDRAPEGLGHKVEEAIGGLQELVGPPHVRVRQAGDTLFADVELPLRSGVPVAEAERVAADARSRVRSVVGERSSVFVQLRAVADDAASIRQRIVEAVAMEAMQAHNITLRRDADGYHADLHLELPGRMTLGDAHAVADRVESRILREVLEVRRVDIHLELHDEEPEPADPLDGSARAAIEARVAELAAGVVGPGRVHDLLLRRTPAGLYLSCHCFFPAGTPLALAHAQTDRLELALRTSLPELARVAVHAEPEGAHE